MQGNWKDGNKFIKDKLYWYVRNTKLTLTKETSWEKCLTIDTTSRVELRGEPYLNEDLDKYYLKNIRVDAYRVQRIEWSEGKKYRLEKYIYEVVEEVKFRRKLSQDLYSDKELRDIKQDNDPSVRNWVAQFDIEEEYDERWYRNQNYYERNWGEYLNTDFLSDSRDCDGNHYNYRKDDYYEKMVLIH